MGSLWPIALTLLTVGCNSFLVDRNSFLSDCSAYDSFMEECLECHITESNAKDFYINFKQSVPEDICQTHIASNPKELIYDVHSSTTYAVVYLDTIYTTIQYTTEVLFEVQNNCESRDRCDDVTYYSVHLKDLKPIHKTALKNFVILLPLSGQTKDKKKLVVIKSHSKDACGGNHSFYNFSTTDINSKYVNSEPSIECPDKKTILLTPANASVGSKVNPVVSFDPPDSIQLITNSDPDKELEMLVDDSDEKESWFKSTVGVVVLTSVLAFVVVVIVIILCACRGRQCANDVVGVQNTDPGARPAAGVQLPHHLQESNVDYPHYAQIQDDNASSNGSSTSGYPVLAQGPPPNPNEYMQVLHHEHTNQAESSSLQRQPLSSGHSSGGTVSLMMPPPNAECYFQDPGNIPNVEPTGDSHRYATNQPVVNDPILNGDDISDQIHDLRQGEPLDEPLN